MFHITEVYRLCVHTNVSAKTDPFVIERYLCRSICLLYDNVVKPGLLYLEILSSCGKRLGPRPLLKNSSEEDKLSVNTYGDVL